MKGFGNLLLIFGIILGAIAITMDTSVSTGFGRVNNLGLMNQQSNLLIGAGIAFISGILLTVLTPKNENSQNKEELSSGSKKCPYCAETIKMEAVICRFCKNDLPVLEPDSPNLATISYSSSVVQCCLKKPKMLLVSGIVILFISVLLASVPILAVSLILLGVWTNNAIKIKLQKGKSNKP